MSPRTVEPGNPVIGLHRRSTLRRRLVLWTTAAVIVPTLLCALVMNIIALDSMQRGQERATRQVTEALAGALSGSIQGDRPGPAAQRAIERLMEDPRVVLIEIAGPDGVTLWNPVEDERARAALEAEHVQWSGGVSQRLADGFLVVHRSPILNTATPTGPSTEGFLIIGIRDGSVSGTLLKLNAWQLAAAGLLCLLVVPVSAWVVARWTAPLEDLRHAVWLLIRGEKPAPIPVHRADDLGQLCQAFNQMVRSLYAAHAQLQESHAKLEGLVKQRTAEVRHANTRLEAEAEDKNEFLRAISHDLNAPLRNIAGMSQMLLMKYREELADDAVNKLERIAANARHQTELIGDLLELSRLRTKPSKPEPVDLREMVQRLAEHLSHDLEQARIELSIEGELPTLHVERNRIRQVFQNLMDNAIKYMLDSPQRRIIVRGERGRDYQPDIFQGVDVWKFTVSDTGKGISEQDLPRMFQVFSRATHSGTHQVAGRGVGLASVRTIVEQLGGRIWVESTLGKGSTFTFTLPVAAVSPEHVEPATQTAQSA